jgi:hypothetical protein
MHNVKNLKHFMLKTLQLVLAAAPCLLTTGLNQQPFGNNSSPLFKIDLFKMVCEETHGSKNDLVGHRPWR